MMSNERRHRFSARRYQRYAPHSDGFGDGSRVGVVDQRLRPMERMIHNRRRAD